MVATRADLSDVFAGVDLGARGCSNIQSLAFGRSNVLAGDPCAPVCTDRHLGFYTLQYTQVPSPSTNLDLDSTQNPSSGWVDIGSFDYGDSDGVGTNYNSTWQRHRYNFDPVSTTGLRLVMPSGDTAIDEFEIYDVSGEFVPPPPPPAPVVISAAEGYRIAWNGNDGDFSDAEAPPDGALVPDNLALASRGAVPLTSSDLGPEIGVDFHRVENVNDGYYGNANSWIGGNANPYSPIQFAGVRLDAATAIDKIAWGRDNGNEITDACGGTCTDRSLGVYAIRFTKFAARCRYAGCWRRRDRLGNVGYRQLSVGRQHLYAALAT